MRDRGHNRRDSEGRPLVDGLATWADLGRFLLELAVLALLVVAILAAIAVGDAALNGRPS